MLLVLGTNVVEDIVSFDLIPHTSIYEAKWLRKFKNSRNRSSSQGGTLERHTGRCGALANALAPSRGRKTNFFIFSKIVIWA